MPASVSYALQQLVAPIEQWLWAYQVAQVGRATPLLFESACTARMLLLVPRILPQIKDCKGETMLNTTQHTCSTVCIAHRPPPPPMTLLPAGLLKIPICTHTHRATCQSCSPSVSPTTQSAASWWDAPQQQPRHLQGIMLPAVALPWTLSLPN